MNDDFLPSQTMIASFLKFVFLLACFLQSIAMYERRTGIDTLGLRRRGKIERGINTTTMEENVEIYLFTLLFKLRNDVIGRAFLHLQYFDRVIIILKIAGMTSQ